MKKKSGICLLTVASGYVLPSQAQITMAEFLSSIEDPLGHFFEKEGERLKKAVDDFSEGARKVFPTPHSLPSEDETADFFNALPKFWKDRNHYETEKRLTVQRIYRLLTEDLSIPEEDYFTKAERTEKNISDAWYYVHTGENKKEYVLKLSKEFKDGEFHESLANFDSLSRDEVHKCVRILFYNTNAAEDFPLTLQAYQAYRKHPGTPPRSHANDITRSLRLSLENPKTGEEIEFLECTITRNPQDEGVLETITLTKLFRNGGNVPEEKLINTFFTESEARKMIRLLFIQNPACHSDYPHIVQSVFKMSSPPSSSSSASTESFSAFSATPSVTSPSPSRPSSPLTTPSSPPSLIESAKIFSLIDHWLVKKPEEAEKLKKKVQAIIQFNITKGGKVVDTWNADFKDKGRILKESAKAPAVTLTMADQDFVDLCCGKINPQLAFFRGKIKVQGNIGAAFKFSSDLFPAINPEILELELHQALEKYTEMQESKLEKKSLGVSQEFSTTLKEMKSFKLISRMVKYFETEKGKEATADVDCTFLFEIRGKASVFLLIDFKSSPATAKEFASSGAAGPTDVQVTMKDDDFFALAEGKLKPELAFMMGKIKLKGDISKAMKLKPSVFPPSTWSEINEVAQ